METAMFIVKRKLPGRGGRDYLRNWDDQYGTSCIGSPALAMKFDSLDAADEAAGRANRTCCGYRGAPMPDGMIFVAEQAPTASCQS